VALHKFSIEPQPNFTTCGPTCLHAVYRHYRDDLPLQDLIAEVPKLDSGGTLGVHLACHALQRGYSARIYSYNLTVFDPTWFPGSPEKLCDKLYQQRKVKVDPKLRAAGDGYARFLELGGDLRLRDLSRRLIYGYLHRGMPILTGLSATYLYRSPRELDETCAEDDVRGEPVGHFVVLCGFDDDEENVLVADPLLPNPLSEDHIYPVSMDRVIGAILLGIVTYDANLLILAPHDGEAADPRK